MKHKYTTKIFSLLLAVILCAAAFALPAFAYAEDAAADEAQARQIGTMVTDGDDLNVRSGAGLDYEVFAQLPNGTMVEVIGTDGDWYRIHLADRDGYVHSDYLSVVAEANVGDAPPSDEALEQLAALLEEGGGAALSVEGNLALLDDLGGADGKQIVTVETRGGNVFYLIIDRDDEGTETVHFLNQVDEADLLALMGDDAPTTEAPAVCTCSGKCVAGEVNTACAICKNNLSECAGKEPVTEPTTEPEPEPVEEKSGSGGVLVILLLLVLAGGGAFAYIKFIKPKQGVTVSADPDDYDFEDEEEYVNEDTEESE